MKTYIIVANNTQGMALHFLLDQADVFNQITAVPRTEDLKMPCGMALRIRPEDKERVQQLAADNKAAYLEIRDIEETGV